MKYSITQLFPGTKSMLYIGLTAVLLVGSGCEKEEQKLGVVEVRTGNGVSYSLYVVKQAPDIPPYEVIWKAIQSDGYYSHNEYVYHPDKSVSDLGYTQKPTKDDEGYYDQIQEHIGGKYSSHFYASKPGANGWWGNSGGAGTGGTGGGGGGTSATEIWYRWTEDLNCYGSSPSSLCRESMVPLYNNSHPQIPDNALKNQYYGPVTPGEYTIVIPREETGTVVTITRILQAPEAGFRRYYTDRIKSHSQQVNRCLFQFYNQGLTYVDEPL